MTDHAQTTRVAPPVAPSVTPTGDRPRFDAALVERLLAPAGDDLDRARQFFRNLLEQAPLTTAVETIVERDGELLNLTDFASGGALHGGLSVQTETAEFEAWRRQANEGSVASLAAGIRELYGRGEGSFASEVALVAADGAGQVADVRVHLIPERDRLYVYSIDVTGRSAAERALAENRGLLEAILHGSPDIVTVTDAVGKIRYMSNALLGLTGRDPTEQQDRTVFEQLHPDDRARVGNAMEHLAAGMSEVVSSRARMARLDGTWLPVDTRTRTLREDDGQLVGFVSIFRDATPDVRMEQTLRNAKDEAEEANRAKDAFLSRMSHELRTPLNAVLGFAQLLEMADLATRERDSVAHIRLAGAHLLRLLDEVLDLTRIESGTFRVDRAPVPLRAALDEALTYVRALAADQGVRIVVGPDQGEWVWADRRRLVQVVLNLLSNAVKFNRPGGTVTIEVTADDRTGRWAVAVGDTGPGLSPSELSRLFVPFERLGADQRGVTGSGIGLALSKSLVEQMDGALRVASVPDEGSTFVVELPRAEPTSAAGVGVQPTAVVEVPVETRLTILYVEDNATNRDLIRHTIRRSGDDRLVLASTGIEGVERAKAERPDVVLLDLHLPDIDGIQVMRLVRAEPELRSVPIIVVSADATRRQITRVLAAGADAYLTKPIQIAELLATLDQYRW